MLMGTMVSGSVVTREQVKGPIHHRYHLTIECIQNTLENRLGSLPHTRLHRTYNRDIHVPNWDQAVYCTDNCIKQIIVDIIIVDRQNAYHTYN